MIVVAAGVGHQVVVDRPAAPAVLDAREAPGMPSASETADAAPPPASPEGDGGAPADADVIAATRDLIGARDGALNSGDAGSLARLSLPGSPAARQDSGLADLLESGTTDIAGLETTISRVAVLDTAEDAARVELASRQSAHVRAGVGGTVDVPEQGERCAVLSLVRVEGRWVLRDVSECRPALRG